ncbi:MAG: glycosyltransferase [Balneolaceae bacterium]|nr:MAG: glycosyltransferase [Balneolaceae bacterium]
MRILIATNSYPTKKNPTHQIFVKNIHKGLKQKYDEVGLVYNLYYRWFKSDLGTGNALSSLLKLLALIWSFLPQFLYKAKSYDVIYSHGELLPGILIPALQKMHGIKHVCYVHGSANDFSKNKGIYFRLTKYVLEKSDFIVTNSNFMQKVIQSEYGLKSTLITPGYNAELFHLRENERTIDISFAGSAIWKKGVDLILKAQHSNKSFYIQNNLKIHLYTDGALKNRLLNTIHTQNLSDIMIIHERITDDELAALFSKSKIVLFPSREEPLGLIGIEAIASGCIVIAANTGGIKEYIIDGENGFLFEPDNVAELQEKIEYVFNNYSSIKEKFKHSHKTVEAYSIKSGIDQTTDFLNSISADR